MNIVDSHHHLWELNALDYIWLKEIGKPKPFGDPTPIQKDYLVKDFLYDVAKTNEVDLFGSVHVQVDSALADPVSETKWLSSDRHRKIPTAIVGYADLSKDYAEDLIKRHLIYPKFRGLRQIVGKLDKHPTLSFTSENFILNKSWKKNFELLKKHKLSFDLQLYPEQMDEYAEFLKDYPEIPVVIDHAGCPYDQSDSGIMIWKRSLTSLSKLPNLYIKLSGFGMYDKKWTSESSQIIFDTIIDKFNSNRIMWGSNFPVESLTKSYSFCIEQLMKWITPLSIKDRTNIASETAKYFYKIDLSY